MRDTPIPCYSCGKKCLRWPSEIKKWEHIYCSKACSAKVNKPGTGNRGKKKSAETRRRMSLAKTKNSQTYSAIHSWVRTQRGSAKKCSKCGLNDPKRRYEWANISGQYKRDLDDFEELCVPCHRRKDGTIKYLEIGQAYMRKKSEERQSFIKMLEVGDFCKVSNENKQNFRNAISFHSRNHNKRFITRTIDEKLWVQRVA